MNYAKIKSLQEIDYNDNVYDLEIEDNHNYVINDHVVHNCHELVLKGLFGPIEKMITTKELMDRDQIANMNIRLVQFDYPAEDRKACSKLDYQGEIDFLVNHEKRNKIIAKMASTLPGNTLVIFQRIEHGKLIHDLIESDKIVQYVAGETHKDNRESMRLEADASNKIILHFGEKQISCYDREIVPLVDGSKKKASEISEDDDILDKWIINKIKALE